MRKDKLNAIAKANKALNERTKNKKTLREVWGDNGDAEIERAVAIEKAIVGDEESHGPLTSEQLITSAIDLARKSDLRSGTIAKVLDYVLKQRTS
tara:strand:+ start:118580 stop:118864 length:285 start_codon:yes stop_codon:yes gene_type:complete